ncbi:MAG: J domain-containing protein [Clostridium sp.]|nr:J domain-containing protein [Clostridium sp.]
MAAERNYYRILEISTQASDEQIKLAYRRLVKRWHPDLNNNSSESQQRLKEINEAYEILSDPTARTIYNQTIAADTMLHSNSTKTKSASELNKEKEEKERRDRVHSVYEKRSKEAGVYYTEFERILEQYKNDRCDSSFSDKLNIMFSDMKSQPAMLRAYAAPMIFFAAVFWHGCDLVARGINGIIALFSS